MVKYMRLLTICQNLFGSQTFLESGQSFMVLSRGFVTTLESPIPNLHIMALTDQYAFGGAYQFDPEKVMKVPRSFISNDAASRSFT